MTQGKCRACRVRWTWRGPRTARRGVRCPCCGGVVQKTTHLLRWRTRLTTNYAVAGWPRGESRCSGMCRQSMEVEEMSEIARLEGGWQPWFNPELP